MHAADNRLRRVMWLVAALAVLFVAVWRWPIADPFKGASTYAPLHLLLETASIVVAGAVFAVVWNSFSRERAGNVLILTCALLAAGVLDLVHELSFAGMPDFVTPSGPEKAINFWLAARFVVAVAFLVVAVRPWKPFDRPGAPWAILGGLSALTAIVVWAGIYHQDWWPRTYIVGQGLTAFKVGAEYAIVAILLVPTAIFYRRSRQGAAYDATSLFAAAAISILSELAFTLYTDVTDIFNLLGHVYKVVAYLFIYRAMFIGSVREPFERATRAEAETRRTTAQMRQLVANLPTAVVLHDSDGAIAYGNPAALEYLGLTEDQLLGRSSYDPDWHFVYEDEATVPPEQYPANRVLTTGQPVRGVVMGVVAKNGTQPRWLFVNAFPETDERGVLRQVVVSFADVTERILASQVRAHLAQIVESTSDAVFSKSLDGTILTWNKGAQEIYGYTTDEIVGRNVEVLAVPGEKDDIPDILRQVTNGERVDRLETVRRRKDGSVIDVWLTVSPIADARGVVTGASTIAHDVTELKRAEEALQASETMYRSLVTAMREGAVFQAADGGITAVNPAAEAIMGRTADQMLARTSQDPEWGAIHEDGTPFPESSTRPWSRSVLGSRSMTW